MRMPAAARAPGIRGASRRAAPWGLRTREVAEAAAVVVARAARREMLRAVGPARRAMDRPLAAPEARTPRLTQQAAAPVAPRSPARTRIRAVPRSAPRARAWAASAPSARIRTP